jgi:hypothetical protein
MIKLPHSKFTKFFYILIRKHESFVDGHPCFISELGYDNLKAYLHHIKRYTDREQIFQRF